MQNIGCLVSVPLHDNKSGEHLRTLHAVFSNTSYLELAHAGCSDYRGV
jgi:hypothetical protein